MSRRWVVAAVALLAAVLIGGPAHGGPYDTQRGTPCEETMEPPPPRCANFDCQDPLFSVFHPPRGSYVSGHCAEMTYPFAAYDVNAAVLAGSANLAALSAITAGSGYQPVATEDGHGIAALAIADYSDTNLGPYREMALAFPVSEGKVTVSTENPYAFVSETLNPEHRVWMHKLILSELMPIDWGREIVGYDKHADPHNIMVRTTAEDTTFSATDSLGKPVLSGHLSLDTNPKAQAQAASQVVTAPHGGEWLKPLLGRGGLAQLNVVNPDVLQRGDALMQSYILLRAKSAPVLGLFGPESALTVNRSSDFGGALSRIELRPVVGLKVPARFVLDTGLAP